MTVVGLVAATSWIASLSAGSLAALVPLVVVYAIAEEIARIGAVLIFAARAQFSIRETAVLTGIGFGLLEISNAFFPERYASVEAQTSPFWLLAGFEFGFGFLLHAALTVMLLTTQRRMGWLAAFAFVCTVHAGWNALLQA